jgi:hypothetical protein
VDWPFPTIDFFAVQKNPVTLASHSRIEPKLCMKYRKLQGAALNPHISAPHRVAADNARVSDNPAAAGETKVILQMIFLLNRFRQTFHSFNDFYQTFLALPLFMARCRNTYPKRLGVIKKRSPWRDVGLVVVEV